MAPKLCRECPTANMQIKNPHVVIWICTRSGRHKNFVDTCEFTKDQTNISFEAYEIAKICKQFVPTATINALKEGT